VARVHVCLDLEYESRKITPRWFDRANGRFTRSGLYRDMRELSQSMKQLVDELAKNPGKIPVTVKLF
jgi:hypothetical protein